MRTFAEKPKANQQAISSKTSVQTQSYFEHNHEANLILHLQRTIGNQAVQRLLEANAEKLEADSTTTASTHFVQDFSPKPLHAIAHAGIQPKLTISTPGDIYEQEADDQVSLDEVERIMCVIHRS